MKYMQKANYAISLFPPRHALLQWVCNDQDMATCQATYIYVYIRVHLLINNPVRPDALHHVVELLLLLLSLVHHVLLVVVPTAHVQAVVIKSRSYSQITSCLQIEKKKPWFDKER